MRFAVLVRGPLGVGKTAVAERLAAEIGGQRISIDQILTDHDLEEWDEGYISEASFLRANRWAAAQAREGIARGLPAIVDGNFYWKSQVEDLVRQVPGRWFLFTLDAPVGVCIARDGLRPIPHGEEATRMVFAKAAGVEVGIRIDARPALPEVVRDLRSYLPK